MRYAVGLRWLQFWVPNLEQNRKRLPEPSKASLLNKREPCTHLFYSTCTSESSITYAFHPRRFFFFEQFPSCLIFACCIDLYYFFYVTMKSVRFNAGPHIVKMKVGSTALYKRLVLWLKPCFTVYVKLYSASFKLNDLNVNFGVNLLRVAHVYPKSEFSPPWHVQGKKKYFACTWFEVNSTSSYSPS